MAGNEVNLFQLIAQDPKIDIDKIRVKLVVLSNNRKAIEPTATYLNRRGWEASVISSSADLFKVLSGYRPDFVFVSANYQHPKFEMLPSVIGQMFKVPVVIFGENGDTKTISRIRSVSADFQFEGQMSGPNAHRKIKQILQDSAKEILDFQNGAKATEKKDYSPVASGTGQEDEGILGIGAKVTSKLKNMFKGKSGNDGGAKDAGMIVAPGAPKMKWGSGPTGSISADELANLAKEFEVAVAGEPEAEFPLVQSDINHVPIEEMTGEDLVVGGLDSEISAPVEAEYEGKMTLMRCCRESFIAAVNRRKGQGAALTESVKNIVMTIGGGRTTGYLVIMHSGSERALKNFTSDFRMEFESRVSQHQMEVIIEETVEVSYPVIYTAESENKDEFGYKLQTIDGEVAIKYLKPALETPAVSSTKSHQKLRISAADIVPGQPVGVDVFIYMPLNKKYYKVLSSSAHMSDKQQEKMASRKIPLFINEQDRQEYEANFTRNRTVAEIGKKRRSKTKRAA